MKEWLSRIRAAKAGPWLAALACCLLAMGLLRLPSGDGGGMTAEEARISQTLSRIAGAGETRVAVYYAQEASAFGSGGGRTPVGAVVVARGAEDIVTRLELRRAAETLLGLSPGQVEVFAMEEKP